MTTIDQVRFERIVHPTDFSRSSARAYDYALLLARLTGAELHVMHVVPYPEELRPSEAVIRQAVTDAEKQLAALPGASMSAAPVIAVRIGSPDREVIRYAREVRADLVVIGTVGLSEVGAGGVGSTAEKVIRGLAIPVLTIKAPPAAKAAGRRCALCGGAAVDVLCDACKDRVRGEAVSRRRG